MKTELRIPTELPPDDPDWILKKKAGKKLDSQQLEEYLKWQHEVNLSNMKQNIQAVNIGLLWPIFLMNHEKKLTCNYPQNCGGWNKEAFDGFDSCANLHPFWAWNEKIDERKCDQSLD